MKTFTDNHIASVLVLVLTLSSLPLSGAADEPYSPYVNRSYPTSVFWGDTHVHTYLSGDAFAMGSRVTPDDAYRFAKGETVRASGGDEARLRRPLDFLMVADHAENLGVLPRLAAGDGSVPETDVSRRWAQVIAGHPSTRDVLQGKDLEAFNRGTRLKLSAKGAHGADYALDEHFRRSVWEEVVANAERHNDPGTFTAFIGYEWSARAPGPMIHRNVVFEGGPDQALQVLPYSRFDSDDPEDLWAYLQDYENRAGGKVLAIPHNTNLSGGQMFKLSTYQGQPLTKSYAQTRARWEPIVEVTQTKGDGETHPLVSPNDEFADYETQGSFKAPSASKSKTAPGSKTKDKQRARRKDGTKGSARVKEPPQDPVQLAAQSYARSALQLGLDQEANLGANPFKFGMIGSTDSHTGLSTPNENDFWGGAGFSEPSRYRTGAGTTLWNNAASGYAAIWATENTRESLFAAMRRRETYASTGPRMTVRFFGGWDYAAADAARPDLARVGYARGVPMGGDLTAAPGGKAPRFLIRAVRDPDGANLDRVQVIKGWRDKDGELHEKIYNVALSDGRAENKKGEVPAVGSTVDVADASYTNTIGDSELAVVWEDPDFDQDELAVYYVRVLEIPTPRWTAYDAKRFGLTDLPDEIPMITQERAYTSPIWYTP